MPAYLTSVLPTISTTLLALDISANFLGALPPALESCFFLEELNVSSNPLRALPLFIANLTSLRVLIADSTGITTLPAPLSALDKLHTLSIRRNKMYSLPSWLCLLVSLQTLLVDYSPSASIVPTSQPTGRDTDSNTDTDADDTQVSPSDGRIQEEEDTITPVRAPVLGRAATSRAVGKISTPPNHSVTRTRTTPNRAYYDKNRGGSNAPAGSSRVVSEHSNALRKAPDSVYVNDLRRMKSAGELRQVPPSVLASPTPPVSPGRLAHSQYVTSVSAFNLLADAEPLPERFATIGPRSPSHEQGSQIPLDYSLWEKPSESRPGPSTSPTQSQSVPGTSRVTSPFPQNAPTYDAEKSATRQRSGSRKKDDKSKDQQPGKWGFLKKMSMGKLRPDTPTQRPSTAQAKLSMTPVTESTTSDSRPIPSEATRPNSISLIDVRLSSTGSLGMDIPGVSADISVSPFITGSKEADMKDKSPSPSPFAARSPSLLSGAPSSPNLLPLSAATRVTKRRSFLPIGGPPTPSSPLPSPGQLSSGISLASTEDDERQLLAPSPIPSETVEQIQRREEERAREAYTRALRSVMAYLRDMNDLSVTPLAIVSMYSPSSPDLAGSGPRSRRPTTTDNGRVTSDGTLSLFAASRSGSSDQLRSPESIAHLRSLNMSQTSSIATTDSGGSTSGEERKFKDDGGRRMKIVKEIVE